MRRLLGPLVVAVASALIAPAAASAASRTFSAVADTYVASSYPNSNYGLGTSMYAKYSTPTERTFVKFDVSLPSGATVTGATLKLYSGSGTTPTGVDVDGVADNTWTEGGVTYDNAPALGAQIGQSGGWSTGLQYISTTLPASYLRDGPNSVGVVRPSTSSEIEFWTKEAGAQYAPLLVVDYTTPPAIVVPKQRWMFMDHTGASAQYGLNIVDVNNKSQADALPAGVQGQIWVGDYNNTTCTWDVSDLQLVSEIQGNASDPKIAGYMISDEPNPFTCPTAPADHKARTALIHRTDTDPNHYVTLVMDSNRPDSIQQVPLWVGTADHIGLDVYPCHTWDSVCEYSQIDNMIAAADKAGMNYWGVVQAFQSTDWRWPVPDELQHMLNQWGASHETGMMVFTWKWTDPTGHTTDLQTQPALLSVLKAFFTGGTADTTAPSAPTGLTATGTTTSSISTSWNASTDDVGVAGYDLYVNGTKVGTTTSTSTSHTFGSLTCGTSYTLAVDAFDAAGNVSGQDSITASTAACPTDTTPPSAPTNLAASAGDQRVGLSWTASTDNVAVAGYDIFRNGTQVGSTTATSFTDTGLTDGTTYTYTVKAFDAAGNVSVASNTVSATPQGPSITVPPQRFMFMDGTGASAQYGLNVADVDSKALADALPAGVEAQVWLGGANLGWNNTTCTWDVPDSQIISEVQSMSNDPKVAGYMISDEPNPFTCPNAPADHKARTALIHRYDPNPSHYVIFVMDSNRPDSIQEVPLWVGTADHVGLNVYACHTWDSVCEYNQIDDMIAAADKAGLNYWGFVGVFQADDWRWPTTDELQHMLNQWGASHETGMGIFTWHWTSPAGVTTDLQTQPALLSVLKAFFTGGTADTTAPSAPTGLTATGTTTSSISTSWNASTDDVGVAGYDLYVNGTKVGTTTSTSHTFGSLTCGTSYALAVDAFDASGNVSGKDSVTDSTAACPVDTTPPPVPTGLAATAGNAEVSLRWNESTDPDGDSVSYNVYRNGAKVGSSTTTSFTDTGLTNGTTYNYQVSAVDSPGNESALSSVVSATPTSSPPPATPHIMEIIMENHGAGAIIGNSNAPFQNSLTSKYITLTNWTGIDHPSSPNYVGMVTGQDNGVAGAGDCSPSIGSTCDWSGDNLGNQMFAAEINAKWFTEDLNGNGCSIANSESGNNDVNHEPWAYMDNWQETAGACAQAGLTTASPGDPEVLDAINSASPPSFVWVTPNLTDDTHDGTIVQGDTYLKNLVTAVQGTSWYAAGGTIIITYDEDEGESNPMGYCTNPVVLPAVGATCIPTFIVSAKDANVGAVSTPGDHYGMLRSLEECYGLPLLNNAGAVNGSGQATYGDIKSRLC